MPLIMPLASHDAAAGISGWHHISQKSCCISFWSFCHKKWNGAIDDTVGIMWHWHYNVASHDQGSYDTHCFNHLDLMNVLMLLKMPLASHSVGSANSVKWLKKPCCTPFWSSLTKKWNSGIDGAITGISKPKESCCTL